MSMTLDEEIESTAPPVSGRSVLAVLGLWLGLSAVLGAAGWFAASALTPHPAASETPTLVVVFLVYALFPVSALIVYRPSGLRDRLRFRPVPVRFFALGLLVWLVVLAACMVVLAVLGLASGSLTGPALSLVRDATDMARIPYANGFDWFLIVVRALLLAGLAEELLFRGVLYGWLRRRLPAWATILLTAALFMVEHIYPVIFPIAFLYGIGVGWLRERCGSVLPGFVVHVLTDTLLFVIALVLLGAHVPA